MFRSASQPGRSDQPEIGKEFDDESVVESLPSETPPDIDASDCFALLNQHDEAAFRFPSAEGHHFVTARGDEIVATYAGPNGPENRPTSISEAAFGQLLDQADDCHLVPTGESPLNDPVLTGSSAGD